MNYRYVLYDFFDKEKANPVIRMFDHKLKKKELFEINEVTYKVVGRWKKNEKRFARIRMTRYKIGNTNTSVMHPCPAKKMEVESFTVNQIKKMKKKLTKKQFGRMKDGRVKLRGHMKVSCPYCKVEFWKESMEFPEKVLVDKVMNQDEDEKQDS